MAENSALDAARIEVIKPPLEVPSDQPDDYSVREEVDLSPVKAGALYRQRYLKHLEEEVAEQKAELDCLRAIEVEHGRLKYSRALSIWLIVLSVILGLGGGGLLSSYSRQENLLGFICGWVFLGVAIVLHMIYAVVPATVTEKQPKASPRAK